MKYVRTYFEEDETGKHECFEQSNGVTVKILREPSEAYEAKRKIEAEKDKIRMDAEKIQQEREALIQQRMHENAEKELIEEGLLE